MAQSQTALLGYLGVVFIALLTFGFFVVRSVARRADSVADRGRADRKRRSGDGSTGDSGTFGQACDGSPGHHRHDGDQGRSGDANGSDGGASDGGGGGGDGGGGD